MQKLLPPILVFLLLAGMIVGTSWVQYPIFVKLMFAGGGALKVVGGAIALLGPAKFLAASSLWYIPFEERAALSEFGDTYLAYCESVRRWL